MLKNTFKIMFSNVHIMFKSFLYQLIIICITLLLGFRVLSPIISEFEKSGVMKSINEFFMQGIFAFDGSVIISSFQDISTTFTDIMSANIDFTWNFIGLFLLLAVFLPIMLGLSKIAEYNVFFGSLSCNSRFDFLTSYFDNFKKGFVFRLYKLIFSIPCFVLCMIIAYAIPKILVGEIATIFAIILVILIILIICSLYISLLLIYEPNLVIKETKPWNAIKNSIREVTKYGFFKVFGIVFLSLFVLFILNAVLAGVSYGIALIFTLPLSLQFINALRMVLCYDILGMDYYITKKSVCVTKKSCYKLSMEEMKDLI